MGRENEVLRTRIATLCAAVLHINAILDVDAPIRRPG